MEEATDLSKVLLDLEMGPATSRGFDGSGCGSEGHSEISRGRDNEITNTENPNYLIPHDFTRQLHLVNTALDNVYTKWSLFPSNPGKEKCGKYLKTGSCSFGAKCKYDHPFHEPISQTVEEDLLLFLTFITERLMKILKTFSYEAAVDVLSSLCTIVSLLESYYDIALTHPSYGQICYLYGDVVIRLSVDIDNFCSNKLSQRRTTPRFKRKGPQLLDPSFHVFEDCAERLESLNQKWLDWEEEIRKGTVTQLLDEDNSTVTHLTRKLSDVILEYAQETLTKQQSIRTICEEVRETLLSLFRQHPNWIEIDLLPFGSHANLLGSSDSDMDLTLQYRGNTDPLEVLDIAGNLAKSAGYILKEVVKETRVPVLKLFSDHHKLEIDIVVNNNLAIYNTTLLRYYALVDPRFRPLVLVVKKWAQRRGCNNPRNATLSSYAWTLMVLYFLMTHSMESQLPSIEDVGKFVEEKQLNLETMRRDLQALASRTDNSLGKLFIQFFAFYGTCSPHGFQPFHSIVSLRNTFRVYKKSSHLHTSVRAKSVGDVLDDRLGLLQAAKAASSELIGSEADTARLDAQEISNMVVYSLSPSWRFCIEDPYEEHDLGKVIFCLTGQIHLMDEMKRCLTLFNDLIVQHRLHFQDQHLQDFEGSSFPNQFNFWAIISSLNHSVPMAIKTCSLCGQEGHFTKECDLMKCHLCSEKGHFMKDCIRLFCSNCRQQGHFAKDCKKEKLCRCCRQPGHQVKDCPYKTCTRCGSKSHPTSRCKVKSESSSNINSSGGQHLNQDHFSRAMVTTPTATEAHPTPAEEKMNSATIADSSTDIVKNLPRRRGRVPPLPLEAKKNSMAKLADLRQGIKIVPPDSPILLSPDEGMDSPLAPSEAKISCHHHEISPPNTEEMLSPEQPVASENKEDGGGRKKKKRKPRNKTNALAAQPSETPSSLFDVRQRNLSLDVSSTNSSPREIFQRKRPPEVSTPPGPTTSERIAHAIRNPTVNRASSIEEKKEIKTSVHFESEANEIGIFATDSKLNESASESQQSPDFKMAAPKNEMLTRRSQSKILTHSTSDGSKYISLHRPPSLLMTHRSQVDASCSELSDFSIDSPNPTPRRIPSHSYQQVAEMKRGVSAAEVKRERKHQGVHHGAQNHAASSQDGYSDAASIFRDLSPAVRPAHRKRVLVTRESKIVETKITDP